MATVVDLRLRPSARAHHLLFVLHALVLAALPFAMASGAPMLLLAAAVGASWLWLRRHPAFGYGPRALVRLVAGPDGDWTLERANGRRIAPARLVDGYRGTSWLVLNFRGADGARATRILLGDETSDEALRRLRLRLAEGLSSAG